MASVSARSGVEAGRSFRSGDVRPGHGRAAIFVAVILLAWSAFAWTVLTPREIVSDWNSWRQADTQTIALNFTKPGSSIFLPTIRWGGDGPGYVEAEFQLYTKMVSVLMRVFGPAEWVGQLVSLLAIVGTAVVIFVHLSRRYQPVAVAVGVLAFLASRPAQHLATVVMPDALALLAYAAAWACFWQYTRLGRGRDLAMFGILGTIAMLTKPTTAHIGISSVLFLVLYRPARLKDTDLGHLGSDGGGGGPLSLARQSSIHRVWKHIRAARGGGSENTAAPPSAHARGAP